MKCPNDGAVSSSSSDFLQPGQLRPKLTGLTVIWTNPPPEMSIITSTSHRCIRFRCNSAAIPTPLRVSMAVSFSNSSSPVYPCFTRMSLVSFSKKRDSMSEPVLNPSIVDDVSMDADEEDEFLDGHEDDELLEDDDYFEDDYFAEEAEPSVGDGAGGGGVSLAGTASDKRAFEIAEEVALSFDGELGIYAFKTLLNAAIQVRIERLTNKSGSPTMEDIEAFSTTYRARLDEAEAKGDIPSNISLEVSSPGVERVIRIPQDFERFEDRNLYVKYIIEVPETGSPSEHDGVFRLISYDSEASSCIWGLADARINREKSGKGRPLSKKQKEWRLSTPLDSLRLVRLFSEI